MSIENQVFNELHPVGVLCKWKLATWVNIVKPVITYTLKDRQGYNPRQRG